MGRRVLVIAGGLVVLAVLAFVWMSRPSPEPEEVVESRPAPAAAPPPSRPAPAPSPAEPAPPPESPARPEPRRRAAAPPPPPAEPASAPAADLVTLRVDSDVTGAQVFVDRKFIGTTPLTTTDLKPGSYRLNVSAPGYDGVAQSLDLAAGERDLVIKLREVRLDASIDVVHKHRFGSCKGRLVATPQGIRYETTNKDDAFRAGLLDMETFEVDYLEKNLRIKVKGKQYNFTDPEDNADHLFVFHRDVQKARERLKKGDPPATP